MLSITQATYQEGYRLLLSFNNGKTGAADLSELVLHDHRPIIQALRSTEQFRRFRLDHDTLVWPNEMDLAPEYLFFLAFKDDPVYTEQFRRWGYLEGHQA